jgi:hypothetical protein
VGLAGKAPSEKRQRASWQIARPAGYCDLSDHGVHPEKVELKKREGRKRQARIDQVLQGGRG